VSILPDRYNKREIVEALQTPRKVRQELRYIYESSKFRLKYRNESSKNPIKEDWDNLIILDACRYDLLRNILTQFNYFDCNIEYKILESSNSRQFRDKYISGNKFHDTVYITANTFGVEVDNSVFHKKYTVYEDNSGGGNYEYFSPETVYNLSVKAYQENSNKRMIVHFMQPHAPYYGEKAKRLRKELSEQGFKFLAWNEDMAQESTKQNGVLPNLLEATRRDLISNGDLIDIYIENIHIVLEYVNMLVTDINGKTIITSDHGEMLRWKIGHGERIYTEGLRKVPWVGLDYEEHREVIKEPPETTDTPNSADLDEQLAALGYK
jgi:hypothetical protein